MFDAEYAYYKLHKRSIKKFRTKCYLDSQRQWAPHEPGPVKTGIRLPYHGIYAQNDAYLEVDNPGWVSRYLMFAGLMFFILVGLYFIFIWFGLSVYPILTGNMIDPFFYIYRSDWIFSVVGWIAFIIGTTMCAVFYVLFFEAGARTLFFSPLRGRIRFNRQTRKVYALRPQCCGGNTIFEWDRLRALMERPESRDSKFKNADFFLTLYHPPWDANDPEAKGEDLIPVGEGFSKGQEESLAGYWEYIRLYMEEGPTDDIPLEDLKPHHRKIPRHIPRLATTYCGKMSFRQYREERQASLIESVFFLLSQITCYWPRFPPEWKSDSGLGEPEDKPVQTGAVMTALVYHQQGKLSREDEIDLLKIRGTPEALQAALNRTA